MAARRRIGQALNKLPPAPPPVEVEDEDGNVVMADDTIIDEEDTLSALSDLAFSASAFGADGPAPRYVPPLAPQYDLAGAINRLSDAMRAIGASGAMRDRAALAEAMRQAYETGIAKYPWYKRIWVRFSDNVIIRWDAVCRWVMAPWCRG